MSNEKNFSYRFLPTHPLDRAKTPQALGTFRFDLSDCAEERDAHSY